MKFTSATFVSEIQGFIYTLIIGVYMQCSKLASDCILQDHSNVEGCRDSGVKNHGCMCR